MAYTLDTAAAAERIASAGVSPEVARAIVSEVARADDGRRDDLATKADLLALEGRHKADLLALEGRHKADLLALEVRLVKWGVGIALGTAGILFAVLRLTG